MRRRDDGLGSRHARTPLALVVVGAVLAACSGPSVTVDPPNSPSAVVASADRIRQGQTRLGGSPACLQDEYCAAGLGRLYGIDLGGGGVALDTPAAVVEALVAGAIDVGALPVGATQTADSRIGVLSDDRHAEPADNVVPVVGPAGAQAGGANLTAALDAVSAAFDQPGLVTIQQGLAAGSSPALAAQRWLQSHAPAVPPPLGAATVVFGARADAESQVVSQVYAGALARAGWPTAVNPVGPGRADEIDALRLGHVGVVPDDAAALLEQLAGFAGVATADLARTVGILRIQLAELGLTAGDPAPASAGTVFAVTRAVAAALAAASLSGLARASAARIPAPPSPAPLTPEELAAATENSLPVEPPTLGVGSTGPEVVSLQRTLTTLGYETAPAGGVFDETTRKAVVGFQIDQGLIGDGALDPATAAALAGAHRVDHPAEAPAPGDGGSIIPAATLAGSGSAGTIYLAFGDGPSPVTPQVLDVLRLNGARATFFVDEMASALYPATIAQLTTAGDAVGISAWPHNAASPIAEDILLRTLSGTEEATAAVRGQTPTCLLAPYGATDAGTAQRAGALGLKTVLWDVDPQDWLHPGADVIASDVIATARPGSIVLLHDGGGDRAQTVTALQTILPTLTALGYGFAPLLGC